LDNYVAVHKFCALNGYKGISNAYYTFVQALNHQR